jgi:hypothetical protein
VTENVAIARFITLAVVVAIVYRVPIRAKVDGEGVELEADPKAGGAETEDDDRPKKGRKRKR